MKTPIGGEYLTQKLHEIFNLRKKIKSRYRNVDKLCDQIKNWGELVKFKLTDF